MAESLMLLGSVWLLYLMVVRLLTRIPVATRSRWQESVSERFTAEGRAHALLREMLSADELRQLMRAGYLEVNSPNHAHRVYRIPGTTGRVRVFDRGREVMELCLQPVEALPHGDVIVLHKLMIQGNEREYLATANHFVPGTVSLTLRMM